MISSVNVSYASLAQNMNKTTEANKSSASSKPSEALSPKAAAIAKLINNGEYKIDLKATAKAMASELTC